MKNYFLLLFLSITVNAQCIESTFLNSISGKNNETIWDIDVDNDDNVYSIGTYLGTVELGGDSFSTPFRGIYVAKNDCAGTSQWTFTPEFINTVGDVRPTISVNENFVYISFTYYGTMIVENTEFFAATLNMFYLKMDLDGNLIWARNIESPNNAFPYSAGIVTDSQDNLYFTGRFNGDIYLNSQQLAVSSRTTCFVGKFDPDGILEWFLDEKISGFSRGWSLALDQQENLILGGYFGGDFQLGDFTVTNPLPNDSETNSYVAKINPEGVVQWISVGYCPLFSHPYGLTVDSDNNILAVGGFDQKIQFENVVMESQGRNDGYIVKFSGEDGSFIWANQFGGNQPIGAGGEWMTSVHQKEDGNYIAIGQLLNSPELNDRIYNTDDNAQDIYIIELTNDGEINDAVKIGEYAIVEQTYDSYLSGNDLILASWYFGTNSRVGCNVLNNSDAQNPATEEALIWKINIDNLLKDYHLFPSFSYDVMADKVDMSNTSTDAADSINWEVDGEFIGSSNEQTVNLSIGEHEVCMVFYACPFSEKSCKTVIVTEVSQQLPVSEFDFVVNGQVVNFTDNSSNNPTSWEWTFGDIGNSSEQNPSFEFPEAAIYEVCLTSTNSNGTGNTICENIDLTTGLEAPITDFSYEVEGNMVTFTDNSSNDPNAWAWTFGTLTFSTNQNSNFTFAGPGTYEICMTASNEQGEGNTQCQSIEIVVGPEPPVTAFDFEINGLSVNFIDQSGNDPNAWEWTFAELGFSIEQSPTFTFPSVAVYEVCLTATNNNGAGEEVCKNVDLADTGIADIYFSSNSVYPVPARDFAFIQLGAYYENLQLDFYDLTGKQIAVDYQINNDGVHVNRGGISGGLYIYKCSADGEIIQTGKFAFE